MMPCYILFSEDYAKEASLTCQEMQLKEKLLPNPWTRWKKCQSIKRLVWPTKISFKAIIKALCQFNWEHFFSFLAVCKIASAPKSMTSENLI